MNRFLYIAAGSLLPLVARADITTSGGGGGSVKLPDPLKGATLPKILTNIFDFLVQAAAVVAPMIIVVGAFQMITAAGSPEKFAKGQKTILYTAIGFVILLMARGIIAIVESVLTT